ncbi:MAG: hypothetical protein FWD68_14860 [Alphaproteobacteria bacterium]|nr:hypothetical protein [Alphaproteobacteria bacterium]
MRYWPLPSSFSHGVVMRAGFSLFLLATPTRAQSPVDTETLREADAILTAVANADSGAMQQHLARLDHLKSTSGLSQHCRKVIRRMWAMAMATIPTDQKAITAEALLTNRKTTYDTRAALLVDERKRCLEGADFWH